MFKNETLRFSRISRVRRLKGYGWVVVVAAFFTYLIADGITFTFGVIYVELLKHFKEGKSKTAWIGGIFMAMPLLSGPVASYLTDRCVVLGIRMGQYRPLEGGSLGAYCYLTRALRMQLVLR